ncbi:hypothetical protein [Acinetobacter baumannii]|uniref:hypothetical protein n=1 Tax=Acinetobacter baumannii TaxID=470 RepID=UPI0011262A53|nr:hypothetical protein [Acinetobacter baumannii]EHU1953722.1 hypothetical protein [Acinetobacter baumannii]EHU2205056.1 hypothetical protein [Acinetobacter baumannii]EHU2219892.1 hypothetical protein [Acinetobacter baumannii]EHU2393427.1 hypothetical protein [Acinetobacter baumannii]EHU2599841.1 hypothetical protein [Acinetobacter baumannii]
MTDLNKLRSEFEALPEIKDKITSYKMDFVNGSYDSLFSHINAWMDGAWFMFQEKAKAQAVSETHTHSVTLTCAELKEAYDFGAPDESQEQMTDLVTIGWHEDGHSGAGYYAYMTECEDEGSIKLGESESGAEK